MVSFKKGQSANEAAAIIALLTFFLVVTLAAVSDDIITASDENYNALLNDMADFVEEEAGIALGAENGYYHEFYLPASLNNQDYAISLINSTARGKDANISLLFVSSVNSRVPLNITRILARDIRGEIAIGKVSVSKEGGMVIIRNFPAPKVISLNPASGPTAGGTIVTITGNHFVDRPAVLFGSIASSVTFVSSAELRAVTPPGSPGPVDVKVANPDGQSSTLASGFTYTSPPPTISSVSPKIGPSIGGTTVTITGTNFIATPAVKFGEQASGVVSFVSSNTLTAIVPASAGGAGFVDVTVINPGGQSATRSNGFMYRIAPVTVGTAFVTSGGYTGSLGGLTGADTKCQALADAGSFGGTWKAWLSTASVNAKDRITDTTYQRLDGKVIANNKADLLNPELSLVNPITIANDGSITTGAVWTGTIFDGTYVGSPSWACNDWASASGNGLYGDRSRTSYYWTWYATLNCATPTSLYCFRTS